MIASTRWSVLAAAAAMIFATGCASTGSLTLSKDQARLRQLQTQLLARADPDSLAAAALVTRQMQEPFLEKTRFAPMRRGRRSFPTARRMPLIG